MIKYQFFLAEIKRSRRYEGTIRRIIGEEAASLV